MIMGKHKNPAEGDGHDPEKPIPRDKPFSTGGGKHEDKGKKGDGKE